MPIGPTPFDRELDGSPSSIVLHTNTRASLITLRADGSSDPLSAAEKTDLLQRSLSGEHVELTVDIRPFSQEDGRPNRNLTRFRKAALTSLGRSGKGSVFLRDHAQRDSTARGGTIIASKMVKEGSVHELHQTVQVVKPWAVQGFLDGTSDRFSIGWHPTGPVLCTACNASIYKCYHWPGDKVAQDDDTVITVEYEFQSAELVETSSVNVPAVTGTSVVDIRAALGLESKPRGERKMPSKPPEKADSVDTKKLEEAAANAAKVKERERSTAIRQTGKALGLSPEFVDEHAKGETSADAFRKLAEDEYAANHKPPVGDSGRPGMTAGDAQKDKTRKEMEDWLLHKSGMHSRLKKKPGYANDGGGQFRGMTLMEMARQCLRVQGVDVSSLGVDDTIRHTLSAGYQAASDFPIALEGVINQEVLAKFEALANTWSLLSTTGSTSDFRDTSIYRQGSFGRLDKLIEGEEIKNKTVPDVVRETIGLETVANIVELGRKAMINDNLGLLVDQAGDLGRAAALSLELDFYALIAENGGLGPLMSDGKSLLHADHKNIAVGSALSIPAIDADASLFAEQTDVTGTTVLALEPNILWLPRSLRGLARKINRSTNDFTTGETVEAPNPVQNQFDQIVATVRLKPTTPRRYTLAALADAPVFRVQFLNGNQTPMLDRQEGFRVLGTSWRIVFDYKVGVVAYEGIQTNAGV